MSAARDTPTRKPRPSSDSRNPDLRVFALTIQWHPDLSRVGEIAVLEHLTIGRPTAVSRLTPLFSGPGSSVKRPLEDDVLKRASPSVEMAIDGRGRIELRPGSTELPTEVDGIATTRSTPLAPTEIDNGVMILIEREILLSLQRLSLSFKREPAESAAGMVGASDGIEKVRSDIRRVADLDIPVLLRGETGTGKELVARAIVAASRRAGKPFIPVNMGGLPAGTAYRDLFGHERGAFTGAVAARPGHFAAADGGTLFLDEIGKTLHEVQASLLRALAEGEVLPLGASRPRRMDVRVIAATDADLEGAVAAGKFDRGLLERLARFQIKLPPLRQRRQDFGPLLLHFLREMLAETGELSRLAPPTGDQKQWLSASKVARLAMRRWPGNVRELKNAAYQIVVSSRGLPRARTDEVLEVVGEKEDWPVPIANAAPARIREAPAIDSQPAPRPHPNPWGISNEELARVFHEHGCSVTKTAAALGLARATVYDMVDRNPLIPKAAERPDHEVSGAVESCGGDVTRAAGLLGISPQALKLRLAQIRRNRSRLR